MRSVRSGLRVIGLACLVLSATTAATVAGQRAHGLSTFGDLKYPREFQHFEYVNPEAPKGGRLITFGGSTFDSFNPFIVKGDAATGVSGLVFDTLMTRADDEPDAVYGLVAHSAEVADDRKSVTFYLRPEALFADGTSVTASDVAFSFEMLKAHGTPGYALALRDVTKAEVLDAHTIRYELTGTRTRDLPLLIAELPILSQSYYNSRSFNETSLEPPLGSGPYRISDFKAGSSVTFQRRNDYWASTLNVMKGRFNFDEIRFDYYRDRNISLEALKARQIDLREEFTSLHWATAYNTPAVETGQLIKMVLPDQSPSAAQGLFINLRRSKFSDIRVRKALDLAFDFEWLNRNIFYGLYTRTTSFFENSDMKAMGPAAADELQLLHPFQPQLSATIFAAPYTPPKTDGSGTNRTNMSQASRLLDQAGWTIKNNQRTNVKGEPFTIEFIFTDAAYMRVFAPYEKNLKSLGIATSVRQVDPAQYERRIKSFEFDLVMQRYSMNLTPGIELRNHWGSEAANTEGSRNLSGVKNPIIDHLINHVIEANSRHELIVAARALDRVMRSEHIWVPNWFKASHTIAFWNKFSRPTVKPKYARGILDTWWYDEKRAAALNAAR